MHWSAKWRFTSAKQLLDQLVPLQQSKVEDRRLVRDMVVTELDDPEVTHRVAVVEHLLEHRVAQRTPLL